MQLKSQPQKKVLGNFKIGHRHPWPLVKHHHPWATRNGGLTFTISCIQVTPESHLDFILYLRALQTLPLPLPCRTFAPATSSPVTTPSPDLLSMEYLTVKAGLGKFVISHFSHVSFSQKTRTWLFVFLSTSHTSHCQEHFSKFIRSGNFHGRLMKMSWLGPNVLHLWRGTNSGNNPFSLNYDFFHYDGLDL